MNVRKFSSEEVPQEFLKWLLSMGCPADVVPSVDKMPLLCRGQYNMIWKSMMEHISSKNAIRNKRLQVFLDDISKCRKICSFNEKTQSVIEPIQLTLWKQKIEANKTLLEKETRIAQAHNDVIIVDKISSLLTQKKLSSGKIENLQRRSWLLQQVLAEFESKKKHLEETRDIAKSLCNISASDNLESKLEKCMGLIKQNLTSQTSQTGTSTFAETDSEETLESLVKYRGDVLWNNLNEKRASLVRELEMAHNEKRENIGRDVGKVEAAVSHSTRAQCSLALRSMKNRQHAKLAQKQLAANIELLGANLSAESCELLVSNCERACARAKVSALKEMLDDVKHSRGVFSLEEPATDDGRPTGRLVANADKDIERERNELVKYLTAQEATEHKISGVETCLTGVFKAFHTNSAKDLIKDGQFDFPQESVAALHDFFSETRRREANGRDLSLEFDASDAIADRSDRATELKIYLQTFSLEKNRKILLKSGEKVWISDTLKSSTERLRRQWLLDDVAPPLCPAAGLEYNLEQIVDDAEDVRGLEEVARRLASGDAPGEGGLDVGDPSRADEASEDRLKKRIAENLGVLEKTKKNLDIAEENLNFWARDEMKKYISSTRTVDGKSFAEYETLYSKAIITKK
ncbi:uncharacterized protein LOC125050621 [Pieris napi]|uniref:uncharacterized protein LOC125050621 n=1 Tax=Pieris napi TaxID=78633 RepID=UPI001FB9A8F2|nr:uncharacterized protein LOC125050621 [Pieris napi]XP_047506533.1 uncharacterized protein LOC125050621 [Pieris napi]